MRTIEQSAETTLRDIAREEYESHGPSWCAVENAVLLRLRSNPSLMNHLLEQYVRIVVHNIVRHECSVARTTLVTAVRNGVDDASGLLAVGKKTLFDYPGPRGKRLGSCNAADCREQASLHRRNKETNAAQERIWEFQAILCDKTGLTVEESISLQELQDEWKRQLVL